MNKIPKIVVNKNRTDILSIIINPCCNPCMQKTGKLLEILNRKKNTTLEIIFLIDDNDISSLNIGSYLLNLYNKDYRQFYLKFYSYVNNFPKSSHNKLYSLYDLKLRKIISLQSEWCRNNGIISTPQFFFNGRQIPFLYTLSDIDYLIS